MASLLPVQWAQAERLYFEGATRLKDIAAECKMSLSSLRKCARARNWPLHSQLQLDGATSERAKLRRLIEKKLNRLETRMDQPDTDNATDSERGSREYASLLTTFEKLNTKDESWRGKVISDTAATTAQDAQPD